MTSQAALARKTRDGQWRSPVVFSAFYIVIIVLARSRGVPAGEIGVMVAMLGVGGSLAP
jgi:hypothetical protein